MKRIILGFIVVLGLSGGLTHAWDDCSNYTGELKQQCEDDTKGRNFVEEVAVNAAGALRDVEEFNLRMQYYLRPYVEADLSFSQWKELYGYGSFGKGPIPTGSFDLPRAEMFGQIGSNTDLRAFILNVLNWVLSFLGLIAIGVIIFAGYMYVVGGEESNEKAKKMILYAAIGIIVILSSYALVNTLITKTIEGGNNFENVQNYVAIDDVVTDIQIQTECVDTNSECEVYPFGSGGGFSAPEYHDVKFFLQGGYLPGDIRNIRWNFGDGGLYEGDAAQNGSIERSFTESKWYNVAVMGQIAKENPDPADENPWNEFVGQMRLWVGDVGVARFRMSPAANPKVGQSVEFDASNSASVAGAIYDYHWTCTPANGVPVTVCSDFETQKEAPANKQKKSFFATFSQPGAVTISLTVDVKIGTEPVIESLPVEEVINIQPLPTATGGSAGLINFTVPNKVIEGASTELKATGAPADGTYEWEFFDGTTDENSPILHTFETAGVEPVILRAYDASGEQIGGEVTKNVIVTSPNKPTAIAAMNGEPIVGGIVLRISRGDEVLFSSLSCDEFGDCGPTANIIQMWKWNGYVVPLEQLDQMTTQMGPHVLTLDVVSKSDSQKKASQSFRIVVENQVPTVEFNVDEDSTLGSGFMRFNITADDIDGEIVRYRLQASEYGKLLDTQMIPTSQGTLSTIMDLSSLVGTHEITFTVEVIDADGGVGKTTKNKTITIDPSISNNQPPTVSIFTTPATTGTTNSVFRFFTQAYDPDGDYLTYTWTFPGGQTVFGKSAVRRFNEAGVYVVKVTVTDGIENVSATETITVLDDSSGGGGGNGTGGGTGSNGNDGVDGNDGIDGVSSLLKTSIEPAGIHCETGGIKIDSGNDENRNGQLDSSEILSTEYVCNGTAGNSGSDGNNGSSGSDGNNGSDGTSGSDGNNGSNGSDGNNGSDGTSGSDGNNGSNGSDGNNGSDGTSGSNGNDGSNGTGSDGNNGISSLVKTGVEPAGTHCKDGGVKIESGEDENNNGQLETSEVTATRYVCNGEDPSSGGSGGTSLNKAPQVQISGMSPGNTGDTTTEFSFFSNASDPDGDTLFYEWNLADGTTSTMKNVSHRYATPGTYKVNLRVSDGETSREVNISVRVVAEGEAIPESTLPPYEPEYHSSPLASGVGNGSQKVLIVAGGEKNLESFTTEIEKIAAQKKQALTQCSTEEECAMLQQQAELLDMVQQKILLLEQETDPVRQQQLNDEITLLLSQVKELDPKITVSFATIEGTTNTTFFLYGQINFETDRPVSIDWETGDGRRFAGQDVAWNYANPGLYTVTMIVSDGTADVTDTLTIKVD